MRFLSLEIFKCIVQNTPLVSIDLIIYNESGEVLLGRRINNPAKGFLFVPGGRIFKNERIDEAFKRITLMELGQELKKEEAKFMGVYEHFYDNSIFGKNISTHYIVLAFKLSLKTNSLNLPDNQHSEFLWLKPEKLISRPDVHTFTKNYFRRL